MGFRYRSSSYSSVLVFASLDPSFVVLSDGQAVLYLFIWREKSDANRGPGMLLSQALARPSSIAPERITLSSLSPALEGLTTQPPALSYVVFLGVTFCFPY